MVSSQATSVNDTISNYKIKIASPINLLLKIHDKYRTFHEHIQQIRCSPSLRWFKFLNIHTSKSDQGYMLSYSKYTELKNNEVLKYDFPGFNCTIIEKMNNAQCTLVKLADGVTFVNSCSLNNRSYMYLIDGVYNNYKLYDFKTDRVNKINATLSVCQSQEKRSLYERLSRYRPLTECLSYNNNL